MSATTKNHIGHRPYDEFITLNYYFITCLRCRVIYLFRVVFIFLPLSIVIRRELAYSLIYSISIRLPVEGSHKSHV